MIMSHRSSKTTITIGKEHSIVAKQPAIEWKEQNGFRYPFPSSAEKNEGNEREVMELHTRGKVIKSFLYGGKFGHTLKIECAASEIRRVRDFIGTDAKAKEEGFKWPISENTLTITNKKEGESEFKWIWDGRNIEISDIAQRKRASADQIQKDAEVYVEFTATGYSAKNNHGCSLKLLSVGLLDDGTKGYNFESPSKKRRMQ